MGLLKTAFVLSLLAVTCLAAETHGNATDHSNSTIDVSKTTTGIPTTVSPIIPTTQNTTTVSPNNTTTTSTTTPATPSTTTTKPTSSTLPPVTTTHSPNITTTIPTPNITTTSTPTPITSSTATPEPTPSPARSWDGPSFFGGMVLAFGIVAVGFVGYRFFYLGRGGAYHTL